MTLYTAKVFIDFHADNQQDANDVVDGLQKLIKRRTDDFEEVLGRQIENVTVNYQAEEYTNP
jgi:polyhydroxyalkanoate synthesis regulator phasin